ncbi:MAG TPA: ThiF family adenylyltransferase [Candidatus Sumerlaeota bacterium]|mgnify:CR=1 FL=1|nr:ThiF family adenylyltransferase [Candidatus Sumerlaeota bacterium]
MDGDLRYSRQILFPPVGTAGQERLGVGRAVVLGCGGLGTSIASLLARAGVGRLRIVDRDWVEESNLQRQMLFDEEDAALQRPKAEAARLHLARINSRVEVEAQVADVNPGNVESLIDGADVVVDGFDNLETRFLVNDACVKHRIPWIYGAAIASHGVTQTILPGETPCLRCVFESAPPAGTAPTCNTAGVLGPVVTLIASLEVAEALKILSGNRDAVCRDLRTLDVWTGEMRSVRTDVFRGQSVCPACGEGRFDYLEGAWDAQMTRATEVCGRGAMQVLPSATMEAFEITALLERLKRVGEVSFDGFMLQFRSSEARLTVFPDGRAIVHEVDDPTVARSLYARFVGS